MTALFTVAQLIVPADGLVTSGRTYFLPDWQRGFIYIVNNNYIRTYTTEKATQTPVRSIPLSGISIYGNGPQAIDAETGDILVYGEYAGRTVLNNMLVFRINPVTGAVGNSDGTGNSFGSYPIGYWAPEGVVSVICAGVAYAVVKEDAFNGTVAVAHMTTPCDHAGHVGNIVSNNRNNRASMCAGASGAGGASAFLIDNNNPSLTSINVYFCRIAPGAGTYNPASWPATNPAITSGTLATIPMGSINPTWTEIVGGSIAYDRTDGNVIIESYTTSSAHIRRFAKVNATTGAIMWVTGDVSVHTQNLMAARLANGKLLLPGGNLAVATTLNTATGVTTVVPLTGLNFSESTVTADSDGLVAFGGTYAAFGTAGSGDYPADPAPGTSSFNNGYGLLWPTSGPPDGGGGGPTIIESLTDAELFFTPTGGFVDFSDAANRRKFVAANGGAEYLGPHGGLPFNTTPAVYLTAQPHQPRTFADNNGTGGAFTIYGDGPS